MISEQAARQEERQDRTQDIAHAWYQAIVGMTFDPHNKREVCDHLAQLVENSLNLLHGKTFSPEKAQAIGAALVDLPSIQGESLGASVELLVRELPAGLSADQLLALQPQLSALLGGIIRGFLQQAPTVTVGKQDLQRTTERLEALHKIESSILQAESPQAVAEIALEHMARIIPSTKSVITHFSVSHSLSVLLAGHNTGMKAGATIPAARDQVEVMKRNRAIFIEDIAAISEKTTGQRVMFEAGGRSLLVVPLLAHGKLIGTMSLIDNKPHAFSDQDVEVTRQIGNSVALAIYNAHLLEMERNAHREAETLREVAASMNASLEQEELLSLILMQLKRVLYYDSATILLYQKGSLGVIAHQGILVQAAKAYKQAEHLPPNLVKLSLEKQPQIISDTRDDPDWVVYPGGEFIRCWLGVPLMVKEELIGLLMLDSPEPNFYTGQAAELALAFANHAAVAIENANLYRDIRQYAEALETRVAERTRELGALYEITAISSQHLELQEALDRVISRISTAMDCRTVTIQLLNETGTTLRLAGQQGLSPQMAGYMQELPVDNMFMENILLGDEPYIVKEAMTDSRLADIPIRIPATYSVGTAIRAEGKALGVLGIAVVRPEPLTREDIALLTSIADQIGVTIESARLRQQSEQLAVLQERERLARDLHDSATQSLFTITLFAAAAREHLSSGQLEAVEKQLIELEETAIQTHKEMRLLLYELRSTVLEKEGLEAALRQRIQMVEVRSGIRGHINADISAELPTSVEQVLFQVASEALNNTLKHSGANTVLINIAANSSHANLRIRDNGQGFAMDDADFNAGMGLDNMRRRVEEMDGTFHHESQPISGTTIVVHIPLEPEEPVGVA